MAYTDINRGNGVRYVKRNKKPFKRICKRCNRKFIKLGKFNWVCPKCQELAHLKAIVKIKQRNRLKLPLMPTKEELNRIKAYLFRNMKHG